LKRNEPSDGRLTRSINRPPSSLLPPTLPLPQARGALVVTAVFEKFTERAIKAVMLAQQEAKALRRPEVGAEHIVMGLIAEEVCSNKHFSPTARFHHLIALVPFN
jgi:hypothetical protein